MFLQVAHEPIPHTSACCQHPMRFCEYVRVTWHDNQLCHGLDKAIPSCWENCVCVWVCCMGTRCSFTVTNCFNLSCNPHRLSLFSIILATSSALTDHQLLCTPAPPKNYFTEIWNTVMCLFHCTFFWWGLTFYRFSLFSFILTIELFIYLFRNKLPLLLLLPEA